MTATDHRFTCRRFAAAAGMLSLLMLCGCEEDLVVEAVPDWGGGVQSPYVPDGYRLAFADEFDSQARTHGVRQVAAEGNGLVAEDEEGGAVWETHFAGWGVRRLEGNNDKALKADAAYRGRGGKSLGELGILLHEFTGDGTLKLYGRPTPPALEHQFELPYLGGMVSGEKLHAQTYGYWEVRLRFNAISAGHHWALWLIPSDHSWPPEIDMLEVVGSNPENQSDAEHFMFNSILTDPNPDSYTRVVPPRGKNAWYTIGFLWTPSEMRWFLDGQEVRKRPAMGGDKALYFLISPEIGNDWAGAPTTDTVWPTEVELDYFRVYEAG